MGYTIREAAAIIGIGPIRLSQWERNIRKPSIDNLIKLAVLYRVLIDELCFDMRQIAVQKIGKHREGVGYISPAIHKNRSP
jgi:transcriptional regulator with XRE-family HTH domain